VLEHDNVAGHGPYVIRVSDPATGVTKPKWVGGFDTEEAAKAARDEARVRARRGEYATRCTSTVADYLAEWLEAHAATVKPKTASPPGQHGTTPAAWYLSPAGESLSTPTP
jgi:hypothetical protein